MRTRSSLACLALALGVCAGVPSVTLAGGIEVKPCALSALQSGALAILDQRQGVFLLSPATGRVQSLVGGFGFYEALNMATASLDGSDAIFVTMNQRSSKGGERAQLVRFNDKGMRLDAWSVPRGLVRLSGVAIDEKKRVVYVANTQPPEIYKLDLDRSPRGGSLVRLAGVPGAARLGAMAFDARRGRLLLADPYLGRVYAYDLASGRSETLLEKVGEVSALALDGGRDRLFLADANGERVLVADLGGRSAAARIFAQTKELDKPLAVALDGAGGVWVGDSDERKVFQFSGAGQQLRAFPLWAAPTSKLAPPL